MIFTKEEKELRSSLECKEICSICKGMCCQRNACNCSPCDFDNDPNKIIEAFKTGNYAIDFHRRTANSFIHTINGLTLNVESIKSNSTECLYVRPRNRDRPIVDIIHLYEDEDEGPCIFWSYERGCELDYENRPKYGRLLVPILPGYCEYLYSSNMVEDLSKEWKPYTDLLFSLAKEYFSEDWWIYQEFNFRL